MVWVGYRVPENEEVARVGLMSDLNPFPYLKSFLRRFENARIGEKTADLIRIGLIKKSVSTGVLLVGDAACQVKPFSAGGLVYGQIGASYAGRACIKALEANDFSEEFLLKNYDEEWKKELAWPIRKGLLLKCFFQQIRDSAWVFKLMSLFGVQKLSSFIDMDLLGKD